MPQFTRWDRLTMRKMQEQSVTLGDLKISIILASPEWAADVLRKRNKHNRKHKPFEVERLANDMRTGAWLALTGEFIKFDIGGALIDGQNRLEAIVVSEHPQWIMVIEGLPTVAREVIDQGVRRNGADVLFFHGDVIRNGGTLAAMLRALGAWEAGFLTNAGQKTSRFNISNSDILKLYDAHPDSVEAVEWATGVRRRVRGVIPTSVLAFAYYVTSHIDSEAAQDFWDGLVNDATSGEGDPRLAMMDLFDYVHEHTTDSKVTGIYAYGIFEAWNLWRAGEVRYSRLTHRYKRKTGETRPRYREIPQPV